MVMQNEKMTDSEIIELLGEYGFSKPEISSIIKKLPSKEFESVIDYIEKIKKEKEDSVDNERKAALEELDKRQNIQKLEEERKERYRELLKNKIAANRLEQKQKEDQENKLLSVEEKPIIIDADVRIRVYLENGDEIYLGFPRESTIKHLHEKIASEIGFSNFEIKRFGHDEVIQISNKFIFEELKAKSAMLEVVKN